VIDNVDMTSSIAENSSENLVDAGVKSVAMIEARIAPLREKLAAHPLYGSIGNERQLRTFMEAHVFAVWDFMSLLKALQARLTCVSVPWVPTKFRESRRFINEIVLGEESDVYEGRAISHFEVYLEAMEQCGAETGLIKKLVQRLAMDGNDLGLDELPKGPRAFVRSTFDVIAAGDIHAQAAAFTFGREDLIPAMFRALVRDLNERTQGRYSQFIWYLERHIEVDGEDHGPLSLKMVADLCGEDERLWQEAAAAAEKALEARLALWDWILGKM